MKAGFVILSHGNFGGAQKRYLNLFFYLNKLSPGQFHFFLTDVTYNQIKVIFPNEDYTHIHVVEEGITSVEERADSQAVPLRPLNRSGLKQLKRIAKKTIFYYLFHFIKDKKRAYTTFKRIEKIVSDNNVTTLMGIYSGIIPLYFYLHRRRAVPKIIFSNMDSWFDNIATNNFEKKYRKYSLFNYGLEHAHLVDFLSPFILDGVIARGVKIKPGTIRITDCSFTDYENCIKGDKSRFIISYSCRLEKDKNPILFTIAAVKLANKYPQVEFHILGAGRLEKDVKDLLNSAHLPNIIFHGFHPRPVEVLARSSVFVSIQTTNNYPSQSVLEAMACGNAIVATNVGDTSLFINNENGLLIELGAENLINALETYISNPAKALEQGNFAYHYVRERFTIKKSAEYYVNLFELELNVRH